MLIPSEASELRVAPTLLAVACALGGIGRVVTDRGYASASWRGAIRLAGAKPVVPAHLTHCAVAYNKPAYRRRHKVENLWARFKERQAIATRYDKTAASYSGGLQLAAALDWLSNRP